MKKILNIIILLACGILAHAQQVSLGPLHSADSPREDWLLPGDTLLQDGKTFVYTGKPVQNVKYTVAKSVRPEMTSQVLTDSLSLQQADGLAPTFYQNPISDLTYGLGYGNSLHKGLNVSVGLSAFATFGKHVPHKGGFTQNIDLTYLTPLSKDGKLWLAGGGYLNNINWGGDSYRDAGLYAILGYKFNEHWEAYVYGQLSLSNNYDNYYNRYYGGYGPYGYGRYGLGYLPGMWGMGGGVMPMGYGMGMPGANVLGAGFKYNVNKNFSIGVNIEGAWYNDKTPGYFGRYDYPVPPTPNKK